MITMGKPPAPSDYAICFARYRGRTAAVISLWCRTSPAAWRTATPPEQAFTNAQDAIASWIAAAITMKRPIPDPSPSHPELLTDSRRTPH